MVQVGRGGTLMGKALWGSLRTFVGHGTVPRQGPRGTSGTTQGHDMGSVLPRCLPRAGKRLAQ